MSTEKHIDEAIQSGRANLRVAKLLKSWCQHANVVRSGGPGLIEQATGLPVGMLEIQCDYARAHSFQSGNLQRVAVKYYYHHCETCQHRSGVAVPNLYTDVITPHEAEKADRQRRQEHRERVEREKLQLRCSARLAFLSPQAPEDSLAQLIDDFDRNPSTDTATRLLNLAQAFPSLALDHHFQALLELLQSDHPLRHRVSIQCLEFLSFPSDRLAVTAIGVLLRHPIIDRPTELMVSVGALVSKYDLSDLDRSLVSSALPYFVHLAIAFDPYQFLPSTPNTNPEPLIKLYQAFPQLVTRLIGEQLRSDHPWRCIEACAAVVLLAEQQSLSFGETLASSVVNGFGLFASVDSYGLDRTPRQYLSILTQLFELFPQIVDQAIQDQLKSCSGQRRRFLFSLYDSSLRYSSVEHEHEIQGPQRIAFKRLVQASLANPRVPEFADLGHMLGSAAEDFPSLVEEHLDSLLGALAIACNELDNPPSPFLANIDQSAIDSFSRSTHLSALRGSLTRALSSLSQTDPLKITNNALQLLHNASGEDIALRCSLINIIGAVAKRGRCFGIIMPTIYTSLMDRLPQIRTAGANAYREICQNHSEQVPGLLHQSFLVLLKDPYLLVHQAALRAIRWVSVPQEHYDAAFDGVLILLHSHLAQGDPHALAKEALEAFISLLRKRTLFDPQASLDAVISCLRTLATKSPHAAADVIQSSFWLLKDSPELPRFLLELLSNEKLSAHFFKELIGCFVLSAANSPELIIALRAQLKAAVVRCQQAGFGFQLDAFKLFSEAHCWQDSIELAQTLMSQLGSARRLRPRRATHMAIISSCSVEQAVSNGDRPELSDKLLAWQEFSSANTFTLSFDNPFLSLFDARVELIRQLFRIADGHDTQQADILQPAQLLEGHCQSSPQASADLVAYLRFCKEIRAFAMLSQWRQAVRQADPASARFLDAAKEIARHLLLTTHSDIALRIRSITQPSEVEGLAGLAIAQPLPLPLSVGVAHPQVSPVDTAQPHEQPQVEPVAVLSFNLHGKKITGLTQINPAVLYDLEVNIQISSWPQNAQTLVLEPVTVEPPDTYRLPRFSIDKKNDLEFPATLKLADRLRIVAPQGFTARPLEFKYRAYFESKAEDRQLSVQVAGTTTLRLSTYDSRIDPQSGYRDIDAKLFTIRTKARLCAGVRDDELADFLYMMTKLGNISGQATHGNIFPGPDWPERSFQVELERFLRSDPKIGQELEAKPNVARGYPDLYYRGMPIELKVENNPRLTPHDTLGIAQTGQYIAGSGHRFGIRCVLETSGAPRPFSVANDLDLLVDEPSPEGFPTLYGAIIIRANLPRPSDLS